MTWKNEINTSADWTQTHYGKFKDTPIWFVRKSKQRGMTFKYVYRSAKELQKHIPLAVNSL